MAATNTAIYAFGHHGNRPLLTKSYGARGSYVDDDKLKLAANYLMDPEHNHPNLDSKHKGNQHVVDLSPKFAEDAKDVATVEKFFVIGLPVYRWSKPVQFFVCVGGIFFFYLIYGYMQVRV